MHRTQRFTVAALILSLAGGTVAVALAAPKGKAGPAPLTLEEARRTVSMLNDLYVTTVVAVHKTYVKDRSSVPAASAANVVFAAMEKKGWPKTEWIALFTPLNPDHRPRDAFEKAAAKALRKGTPRYEKVVGKQLRVATLIPLVDKKCQMCHPQIKVGDPVGGLSYTVNLK